MNITLAVQSTFKISRYLSRSARRSFTMGSTHPTSGVFKTRILPIGATDAGHFEDPASLEKWITPTFDLESLHLAADHLKHSSIPVGFPTETVYGLGADATRSDAVKGIYKAKGRPSDNPLIIHVCDLTMLRSLLSSSEGTDGSTADPIPEVYKPLIKAFWPGPLTILLPNPTPSKLAPEVTAGLPSFGARMPSSPLALSLIHLAGVPLAAPSANASTRPSPTTAQHVLHDLDGRIEIILDGGPCQVGVESTVVDGLCDPPVVLRPGGVSIDCIRECEGWEKVLKGYKDASEAGNQAPRAPGMKYKHYSPKAKVVLFETALSPKNSTGTSSELCNIMLALDKRIEHLGYEALDRAPLIGIISTKNWSEFGILNCAKWEDDSGEPAPMVLQKQTVRTSNAFEMHRGELSRYTGPLNKRHVADVLEIPLGGETKFIAQCLFSALRELDLKGVDVIYVEGIEDEGDIAAAVMNRLRKAATIVNK